MTLPDCDEECDFSGVIIAEIIFNNLQCVYKWLDFSFIFTVIMETAWYRASEECFAVFFSFGGT